ncbi:MAG: FecR family protein [Chloroflexota bacterium]
MTHTTTSRWPVVVSGLLLLVLGLSACQPAQATPVLPTTAAPTSPPLPTAIPPTVAPSISARLSELQKEVEVCPRPDDTWQEAKEGQTLWAGGEVKTGDEARARLDISDSAIIRLGANSQFELAEMTMTGSDPLTRLRLEAGKVWVALTRELGRGEFEIETPVGAVSVRGSYLSAEFSEATGRLVATCLEGQCRLAVSGGQYTDLSQDQQAAIAKAGENPSPPQPMDAAQYADWARNFPEAPAPPLTSILLTPGSNQCSPKTIPAGAVELVMGMGRWKTPEEAATAVGDSSPTITLNGDTVAIHDRSGPEWHTGDGEPGWGFSTRSYLMLEPGDYTTTAQWRFDDVFTCTFQVVSR